MGGRTRRQLTRKVVQGIACSSILRKRAFFHGRPNRLRVVAGRPVSLRWAADANYSTKLRRIKNESSYKSWGRHSLRLDASGVLASNTSASAALHSSNQFSLRRLISGNKRQSGLWSLRNSLACRSRQYSKIMSSSCMLSPCLLDILPISKPQFMGRAKQTVDNEITFARGDRSATTKP